MNNFTNTSLIFWGTSEFAVPSLEALHKAGYDIRAVITNPDELVGRKQVLTPPAVKSLIIKHKWNIRVLQPENLKTIDQDVLGINPDLFIVAAYGKIIPKNILAIPKLGALNTHPSLLPRWRGPSPIQSAILAGDTEMGVTVMKMDEQMDHGPIMANRVKRIANSKITYQKLHDELADMGADLLIATLPKWLGGETTPTPQDDAKATYCKILKRDDGRISWSRPAEEIERMVRAFNPWPGTWTMWPSDSKIFRVRIEEADWTTDEAIEGSPGYIWHNELNPLLIKTSRGSIVVKKLKIEGRNLLDAESFIRGNKKIIGTVFV